MKIEKLKMTRMHNLFIIALSAMCVACGGKNQGRQQTVPEFAVITLQPETVKLPLLIRQLSKDARMSRSVRM